MSDELISKDKILKTIREWTNEYIPQTLYGDGYDDAVKDIIKLIETEIPVRAVELKTGRWIDIAVGDMPAQACDQCKTFYALAYTGGKHRYCPNCGAKMEEGNK